MGSPNIEILETSKKMYKIDSLFECAMKKVT